MRVIEKIAKKAGINIHVQGITMEDQMTELVGFLRKDTKDKQDALTILEKTLQEKYDNVYLRDDEENFRILFPTEIFLKVLKHQK